mmetsp:Transcript_13260/g.12836  ORF Transcript_13260/g.12836 Transcript_13260/m.12836 type:complete len:684 (+) Transcript_13260:102-2153(+)|eukprot:CAMPEP_0119035826 /NCGR_PEP_ID=MMETSP1177-20130426/3044_1 /TAXON_ID=2985 /ORGANISM="Ochromonas sp, Strain CCMP1899" /LENGTH=683 /DNA_ID=CAMNT_0006994625 /DNA_START=68 /DNA_END=2119 /DNA_ORIENTATION=-
MAQLDSLILIAEWAAYQEMGDIFEGTLSKIREIADINYPVINSVLDQRIHFYYFLQGLSKLDYCDTVSFKDILNSYDNLEINYLKKCNEKVASDYKWFQTRYSFFVEMGVGLLRQRIGLTVTDCPEDEALIPTPPTFKLSAYRKQLLDLFAEFKDHESSTLSEEEVKEMIKSSVADLCDIMTGQGVKAGKVLSKLKLKRLFMNHKLSDFIDSTGKWVRDVNSMVLPVPTLQGQYVERRNPSVLEDFPRSPDWDGETRRLRGPYAEKDAGGGDESRRSSAHTARSSISPQRNARSSTPPQRNGKGGHMGSSSHRQTEGTSVEIVAHIPGTLDRARKEFERKNSARDPLKEDYDDRDVLEKAMASMNQMAPQASNITKPQKKGSSTSMGNVPSVGRNSKNEAVSTHGLTNKSSSSMSASSTSRGTGGNHRGGDDADEVMTQDQNEFYDQRGRQNEVDSSDDEDEDNPSSDREYQEHEKRLAKNRKRYKVDRNKALQEKIEDLKAGEGPSSKLRSSGSRKATRLDEFAGAVEDVEKKRRRLDDMQRQATSKVIFDSEDDMIEDSSEEGGGEDGDGDFQDEYHQAKLLDKLRQDNSSRRERYPDQLQYIKPDDDLRRGLQPRAAFGSRSRVVWTLDEENALQEGMKKYGFGKWVDIKKDREFGEILKDRTNINCKDKYRNMCKTQGV